MCFTRSLITKLFLVVCIFYGCSGQKSFFNGGFEELDKNGKAKGWEFGNQEHNNGTTITLDSKEKVEGKYSLLINRTSEKAGFNAALYEIPRQYKGKLLQVRGYLKTENVTNGFAGLLLGIKGPNGILGWENMEDQGVVGTTDWKEYSIIIPYNDLISTTIYIGASLSGNGKLWIDNIRLFIDGKSIERKIIKDSNPHKTNSSSSSLNHSGIDSIPINKQIITNLKMLAQVWGLLKYYHPAVAKGVYDFDVELFKIMPQVIKASDNNQLSMVIDEWVNKFGLPSNCIDCKCSNNYNVHKPDFSSLFNSNVFSIAVINKLKFIANNQISGKNHYVMMAPGLGNPLFQNEKAFDRLIYKDVGFRMLCLFRYWNTIQYFYPYKHLIGQDWEKVLEDFIPKFITSGNELKYNLTTLAMICSIHDTHANISSYNEPIESYKGKFILPFRAKFVENKLIIVGFYNDSSPLKKFVAIGDIIQAINGAKIDQLIKKYQYITAGSNYITQLRELPNAYLLRTNKEAVSLNIIRNGKSYKLNVKSISRINLEPGSGDTTQAYKIIKGDIGYLFAGKYKNSDLSNIEMLFSRTRGIIVDMRCYPGDFMPFTFVPFIKTGNNDFVKFTEGSTCKPGSFSLSKPLANQGTGQYKGKVIVIVNELTQSQAEYTTMAFQSSPNVIVVGSTTAGADGTISRIILPGQITTIISGKGILYPDGTETQRKGIKIDYQVNPTIKGIKFNRDEPLEKAIALMN